MLVGTWVEKAEDRSKVFFLIKSGILRKEWGQDDFWPEQLEE